MKVILCWNPNWSDMHLINKLMCADSFIFLILHQHSISITWTSSHKECYNTFLSDIICQAWLLHFSFEYSFSMLLKFDFKYTLVSLLYYIPHLHGTLQIHIFVKLIALEVPTLMRRLQRMVEWVETFAIFLMFRNPKHPILRKGRKE